jgi:hypothetical protein
MSLSMQSAKMTLVLITMTATASSWAAMRPHLDLQTLCAEAIDVVECEVGHLGEKGFIESQELVITTIWKGNRRAGEKVSAPPTRDFRFYYRLNANDSGSEIAFPVIVKLLIFLSKSDDGDKDPVLHNGVIAIDSEGFAYSMEQQLWNPSPYVLVKFENQDCDRTSLISKLEKCLAQSEFEAVASHLEK